MSDSRQEQENLEVAKRWCALQGNGWAIIDTAGRGGTAPVFTVISPSGPLALKLYDAKFSEGKLGEESERRLGPQLGLGLHDCPHLVRIHDGGRFENRLFVLMDRAPGQELERVLKEVPRENIRSIVDQVARAAIFLRKNDLCHRDIKSANIFISEDFSNTTLLDLSVLRDIDDPIGLGTDEGGQLPVVATSRYSPPEYLFRLVPPGPDLWYALDVYQLGGVLHDLIMQEPMFEQEYQRSRDTNRYRFAWIVATQDPIVSAPDVDPDLVVLARRALDKDWTRRSALRLEDFLDEASTQRAHGLLALGASVAGQPSPQTRGAVSRQMTALAEAVESSLVAGLKGLGITARHDTIACASDSERLLRFSWDPSTFDPSASLATITFDIYIKRSKSTSGVRLEERVTLTAKRDGKEHRLVTDLPSISETEDSSTSLGAAAMSALGEMAGRIIRL